MKVILIQPPFNANIIHFPFGIAYIASYLEQFGHEITILDINADRIPIDEIIHNLPDCDSIGISALVNQYDYVQQLCSKLKENVDAPIIIGNGLGTTCHEWLLEKNASMDICVRGEGEETFRDILNHLDNLINVPGITYRNSAGRIQINPDRDIHSDVDKYPIPAYHLFEMERYLHSKLSTTGQFEIRDLYQNKKIFPMVTARGCPFNCTFCSKVIKKTRMRSVESIVAEIGFLKEHYAIEGIHFVDELFVINKKRAIALSEALKPLNIFWDCQCRVDTIDYETLHIMKGSGCVSIGFGIESGSQKILDLMNKKITVEKIENAIKIANQVDLEVKVQLIIGYPGEDWESLRETIKMFKSVNYPVRGFNYIIPLPGTPLYAEIRQKKIIVDDEEYLHELYRMYFKSSPELLNLTNFTNAEYLELDNIVSNVINTNFTVFLWTHPAVFLNKLKKFGFLSLAWNSIKVLKRCLKNRNTPVRRKLENALQY